MGEGKVTWCGRESESAIDYIVVNQKARKQVSSMWVDEERKIDVTSDHNVLVMEYECMKENHVFTNEERKERWKLRTADWFRFREELDKEDWRIDKNYLSAERGVEELNDRLVRIITKIAEASIGKTSKRKNGKVRKKWWNSEIESVRKERKHLNKKCRRLRKNKAKGEAERREYEYKQKEVKHLVRKTKVSEERKLIRELREKGEEGGKECYKLLRGEEDRKNRECGTTDGE